MKKKFWCFVLACVLLVGTLSGCSQSADNSSSADSSIAQSVEESTPEEENSQASEEVAGAPAERLPALVAGVVRPAAFPLGDGRVGEIEISHDYAALKVSSTSASG